MRIPKPVSNGVENGPSRPILAVKNVTYIQALRLNTVQPIGPLTFFFLSRRTSRDTLSINCILTSSRPWCPGPGKCLICTLNSKPWMRSKMRFKIIYMFSIYTISDLGDSSNLTGSLSRTMTLLYRGRREI